MAEKIITLSGAATDVLYALFYRGALLSGDLPSKSGAAELRELGFAETRHTATEYQKENHFTFLTSEGQKFAVEHLVNTRFGMPASGCYISSYLDALDEIAELPHYRISSDIAIQQKIADALDTWLARRHEQLGDAEREKQVVAFMDGRWVAIRGDFTPDEIREAAEYIHRYRLSKKLQKSMEDISPFVVKNGEVFIKDAFIGGAIDSAAPEVTQAVTNVYNINFGVSRNKSEKADFSDNGIDIHVNVEDLLRNALAAHEEIERLRKAGDVAKKVAADTKAMDELADHVRKVVMQECSPGGIIRRQLSR
ncbi:Fur-regulated protein [Citrobacter telavivensis]